MIVSSHSSRPSCVPPMLSSEHRLGCSAAQACRSAVSSSSAKHTERAAGVRPQDHESAEIETGLTMLDGTRAVLLHVW